MLFAFANESEGPKAIARRLESEGLIGQVVEVVPLTNSDAVTIAELQLLMKAAGLSLGDRACLALGLSTSLPVLTSNRTWVDLDLDVDVHTIR